MIDLRQASRRVPAVESRSSRTALRRAALGLLAIVAACAPPAPEGPPNLLLITVDTLRADRLACYGGAPDVGNTICSIGDSGARFVWAFASASSTGPSVASILTSQYPSEHRVTQFTTTRMPDEALTVAEVLSQAGYATAAFVSNPVLRRARNFDQGFDLYDDEMTRREPNRPNWREREAAAATEAALLWARNTEGPWFLWIHYQDPHGPYTAPDGTAGGDAAGDPPLPVLQDHSGWRGIPAYQRIPGLFTARAYERRYADEIRYLDRQVRRLLDGLAEVGDEPSVVLTADHGEAFGEDEFYFAHGHSLGLDQIRVPLLYRSSGRERGRGRVVEQPASILDVAPTLLAEAGLPAPERFRGHSLSRTDHTPRLLFAEHRLRIAMITGRTYYARDTVRMPAPVPDPITGGVLPPLPARTARLDGDGRWQAYRVATADGIAGDLEPFLAAHLRRAAGGKAAEEITLDPGTEEMLRSLGYVE